MRGAAGARFRGTRKVWFSPHQGGIFQRLLPSWGELSMWSELVRACRKVVDLFWAGTGATSARTEFVKTEGGAARIAGTIAFEFTTADKRLRTPAEREEFKADVCRELTRIAQWAADMNWSAPAQQQLCILISDGWECCSLLLWLPWRK